MFQDLVFECNLVYCVNAAELLREKNICINIYFTEFP